MIDYIDVLPVRIHPQPLESITSGLIRVAEANRIATVSALSALAFPGKERQRSAALTDVFVDGSGEALVDVARMLMVANDVLLRMTVNHLLCKFGSASPKGIGMFLSDALAPHLRYCPLCVAERGYYSLLWRFRVLTGCVVHGCRLRDHCGACGASIRLLPQRLRLGICPSCGNDLRSDEIEPMAEDDWRESWLTERELTFLLSPHQDEDIPSRFRDVFAKGYTVERLRDGMTAPQVAAALGLPDEVVHSMERGGSRFGYSRLVWHLAYARYLGTRLDALYASTSSGMALDMAPHTLSHVGSAFTHLRDHYEAHTITRLREARERLRVRGRLATRAAILKEAGLTLKGVVSLKPVLTHLNTYPRTASDDDMAACVERAIVALQDERREVSIYTVAGRVGSSVAHLRMRASAMSVLSAHGYRDEAYLAREEAMLQLVREAYDGLEGGLLPPRTTDICVALGIKHGTLYYYPRVQAFLQAVAEARREAERVDRERRGAELLSRVEEVVRRWDDPVPITTIDDVAERVGVSIQVMRVYPPIAAVLKTVSTRLRDQRAREAAEAMRRRDEEWSAHVEGAILELRRTNQRPSVTMVARHLDIAPANLYCYPRTRERLRRLV